MIKEAWRWEGALPNMFWEDSKGSAWDQYLTSMPLYRHAKVFSNNGKVWGVQVFGHGNVIAENLATIEEAKAIAELHVARDEDGRS